MSKPVLVTIPKHAEVREDSEGIYVTCNGETATFAKGSVILSDGDILQDWTDVPEKVSSKIIGEALVNLRKANTEMVRGHKELHYGLQVTLEELIFAQIALRDLARAIESRDDLKLKHALENHESTIRKAKEQQP